MTPLVNGGNGGWDPQNRPSLSCPGGYCGYAGNPDDDADDGRRAIPECDAAELEQRRRVAGDGAGGVSRRRRSGGAWNGRLAVGIMGGSRLVILELNAAGTATSAVDASLPDVRYRGLTLGPDGNLYVATDDGEIWRVTPSAASP